MVKRGFDKADSRGSIPLGPTLISIKQILLCLL